MKKLVITIDGIDGAGKSTFARNLAASLERLHGRAVIVSVDEFRRPVDWAAAPSEVDAYYETYYDLALCQRCLEAFVAGAPAMTIPAYDSASERIVGTRTLAFDGVAVAIVEGVFPLRVPLATQAPVVFLDASEAEARRRILTRDQRKGRTVEEIERRIANRYFPAQKRYWAQLRPRDRADVLIDNEIPESPRVLRCDLSRVADPIRSVLEQFLPAAAA